MDPNRLAGEAAKDLTRKQTNVFRVTSLTKSNGGAGERRKRTFLLERAKTFTRRNNLLKSASWKRQRLAYQPTTCRPKVGDILPEVLS